MIQIVQDIRFGFRMLSRRPGVTALAVFTLALGIGANTSVFSLVNTVLLRPLPFPDAARLVVLTERSGTDVRGNVSGHEFVAWQEQNRTLEHVAMYSYSGFNITGTSQPEAVQARVVTGDYFTVLREQPLHGRAIVQGDERSGAAPVALLSERLWQRRFGADPRVVGSAIELNNVAHTIVGVMPDRREFDPDLWVALDLAAEARKVGRHALMVIARLAPGATLETAQADLSAIAQRLARDLPDFNTNHDVQVTGMREAMVGDVRRPLLVFLGAVAFILLIACANVAHLLLMRAATRQREFAIRATLGAGRARLMTQLLTESVLLGLAGGAAGMLLAVWVVDLLPTLTAVELPRMQELGSAAAIALLLALIGIYGVISHTVARRTQEIGIRAALGADSPAVLKLVLGSALGLSATGIGLGLIGAFALSRVLQRMLFEVEPTDPATFALIALLLSLVALLACYIPTRRALRIDPLVALRSE